MNLTLSRQSITAIINFEVSSRDYYNKFCAHPTFPGIASGITIGVGFDTGYHTAEQIVHDWSGSLPEDAVSKLALLAGFTGARAKAALTDGIKQIVVPFEVAMQVFETCTLPFYAKEALAAYPGLDALAPDAVGGIVSLVFNRGASLFCNPSDPDNRRREMAAIKPLVAQKDYAGIASQILSMKRLWDGIPDYRGEDEKRAQGLLDRRDKEAQLVRNAVHQYAPSELIVINC